MYVICNYPCRDSELNRAINEKCIDTFTDCFRKLDLKYPWVFKLGRGNYSQTVCFPIQDESMKESGGDMIYEDDCEATWPGDMDAEYDLAVELFTSRLTKLLPNSNRFNRVD